MSILPSSHSPDMTSWFSMYFPLKSPQYAPQGAKINARFWRRTDSRRVWYEWSASVELGGIELLSFHSAIHNSQGTASSFGL
jgi:protein arginine N-methyltransferase 5